MADWYRHDIPSWMDGTGTLSDAAYRAFHVICELIYVNEGPITLNERGIAGSCNQRLDRFRAALAELVATDKVELRDGRIHNGRCEREIEKLYSNRQNARKGGRTPRETRKNPQVTDTSPHAHRMLTDHSPLGLESSPHTHRSLSDDKSLENIETGASDAPTICKPIRRDETRNNILSEPVVSDGKMTGNSSEGKPRKKPVYPPDFEEFWTAYPTDRNMPKAEALKAWLRLDEADRTAATASVPSFRRHCRDNAWYRPKHASTYLNSRTFDGHAPTPAADAAPAILPERTQRHIAERFLLEELWQPNWGPRPGAAGCRIPDAVFAEVARERGVAWPVAGKAAA